MKLQTNRKNKASEVWLVFIFFLLVFLCLVLVLGVGAQNPLLVRI